MAEDYSVFNDEVMEEDYNSYNEVPQNVKKQTPSDLNVAAQTSLSFSAPEDAVDTFKRIKSELELGDSGTLVNELRRGHEAIQQQNMEMVDRAALEFRSAITPEEDLESLIIGANKFNQNSQDILATESAIDFAGNETAQAEVNRVEDVSLLEHMSNIKRVKQSILSGEYFGGKDPGITPLVGDFLELLIPFSEGKITKDLVNGMKLGDVASANKGFVLLGEIKTDLREVYLNLDYDQRIDFMKKLAVVLENTSGLTFMNDNDLVQRDLFLSITEGGHYGTVERVIDDVGSVLDLIGVGFLVRGIGKSLKVGDKSVDMYSAVKRRSTKSLSQPAAPLNVVKDSNPEKTRNLYAITQLDETNQSSKVLSGSNKAETSTDVLLPQVRLDENIVENRVHNIDQNIVEWEMREGRIDLTVDEISRIKKAQLEHMDQALGSYNRREMNTMVRLDGESMPLVAITKPVEGKVGIIHRNVYGPKDGGFTDPQLALDHTEFALKDFGVSKEEMILLQKVGDEYVPTTVKDWQAKALLRDEFVKKKKKLPEELRAENMKNNFLVQINYEQPIDPTNLRNFDEFSVKRNWFDYIPILNRAKKGDAGFNRFVFDPASIFEKEIVLGANVAVDRSSSLEKVLTVGADEFVKPFKSFSPERQEYIRKVLKDANLQGKMPDYSALRASGASEEEIKALQAWKKTTDDLYWLENKDAAESLSNQGFQLYANPQAGTNLIAKPIKQGWFNANPVRAYSPSMDEFITVDGARAAEIYESGGKVGKLRYPEDINGTKVEYILSEEKSGGGFLRAIRSNDQILNYREGYYAVRYKDPHFIDMIQRDELGNIISRSAVKTAPDVKSAEILVKNLTDSNVEEGLEFVARTERAKSLRTFDDDYWDLQHNSGRIAQRVRGERVRQFTGDSADNAFGSIEGPVESLLNSIRSTSRRTSMRDFIDTYKQRFVDQYGDLLKSDQFGNKIFPNSAEDLEAITREGSKLMADARANLEYIHYMENGYRNSLDDLWKGLLNGMGDVVGKVSPATERGIRAVGEEVPSLAGFAKMRAFEAYLALNPVRQFVIQGHQASLLAANFPKYVISQGLSKDLTSMYLGRLAGDNMDQLRIAAKISNRSPEELKQMLKDWDLSGLGVGIDRHNLIEGGMEELVESTRFQKFKAVKDKVIGTSRKIGFDAGENINMMSAWLAHRQAAVKSGVKLDSRALQEISGKARNYTFNMNLAGDMAYNRTSASLLFQFMQVPHKAILQVTSNRVLSKAEKLRLATYNAVMLPLPIGVSMALIDSLDIKDPEAQELVLNGLEGYMVNQLMEVTFGEESEIDISSLTAIDPDAPWKLINGLLTTDVGEIISSSPSGQLFFGYNPRVGAIVDEVQGLFTKPDLEAEDADGLWTAFAQYSSGYANFSKGFKELMVQDYARRYNAKGIIVDQEVTTPESFAKMLFGLGTLDERLSRIIKNDMFVEVSAKREDVKELYRINSLATARRGFDQEDTEYVQRVLRMGFVALEGQPELIKMYKDLVIKDLRKGQAPLFTDIAKKTGWIGAESALEKIRVVPNLTEDERDKAMKIYEDLKEMSNETLELD